MVRYIVLFISFFISFSAFAAETKEPEGAFANRPLVERYVLDELRQIKQDQLGMIANIEKRIADTRVEITDRSMRYMTDTVNIIFYIITAVASLLVIAGWNSLRDMRGKIEDIVNSRLETITKEYQDRLYDVEEKLKTRSAEILKTQEEIAKTNEIHSLWMRIGLEGNTQTRIDLYDEIINLNPNDAAAYAYKADAVLEMGESEWAINLCNQAIEEDPNYGYSYWQRACANAESGNKKEAIDDIKVALEKAPNLSMDIESEASFKTLENTKEFQDLLALYKTDTI